MVRLTKPENRLLAALPAEEYERLLPHLELVSLSLQQVLHASGEPIEYVYFPHQTIVSLLKILEDGTTVEVGLVGNEGMAGISVVLGSDISVNDAIVQMAGSGMRMPVAPLIDEFKRGGVLQSLLLRYLQALLVQTSQGVACNRIHSIEERLARWLLTVSDRLDSSNLSLTQEFIAQMLGTRRAGVTVAAGILQDAGMISYRRGRITIRDRENLKAASCECYQTIKNEYNRLLGTNYK